MITTDARISGSLSLADGSPGYLPVQYDYNNDGVIDGTINADAMGQFVIDLRSLNLPDGSRTVKVRGGRYLNGPMMATYGEWSTFTFTNYVPPPVLPVVANLALVNDTGTPGDLITTDARISGSLTLADGSPVYLPVEYDYNNDGITDGTLYTDMLGQFVIDLRSLNLPDGSRTVKVRGGRYLSGPMMPTYGDWSTFTFTNYVPPPVLPAVANLALVNDTGTPGDLITTDARISGSLTLADGAPAYLPVQYDYNNDGIADGTINTDMAGQFIVDLRSLNLPDGSRTVKVRGGRYLNGPMMASYGEWSTFTFTNYVPPPVMPVVANLSLVNDTGTPGDLITTDARISGSVTLADGSSAYLPVQYDCNNDGTVDGTVYADMTGQFTIDLQSLNLSGGSKTIMVRSGRNLNGPMSTTYGEWSTFTFTLTAPALPAVSGLALVNDTGTPADLITTDARISGSLTLADGAPAYLPVQYDYNNDGMIDGTINTDASGQFIIDLRSLNLPDGARTVKVRGGRYLNGPMMPTYGEWATFTFTNYVPPPALPAVANLTLVNDTGTPGDLITTDARVSGSVTLADGSSAYLPVQYDYNNDGTVDGTVYADMMGQFIIDLQSLNLPGGSKTVMVRSGRNLNGPMSTTYGEWSTFTFTLAAPALPVVGGLALVNDTGTPGDMITTDARISGSVTLADGSVSSLPVQYDWNNDGMIDGTVYTDMTGQFTVDLRSLNLPDGARTVKIRGGRYLDGPMMPTYGEWATFNFTYSVPPPALPAVSNLVLVNDTGTPGDLVTTDARVSGSLTLSDGSAAYLPVQYDLNADGIADGTVYSDMMGQFTVDLRNSNLTSGSQAIAFRGGRNLNGPMSTTYGTWSSFTFTLVATVLPAVTNLSLVNDTGTAGDLITTDPRVTGSVTWAEGGVASLPVQYDWNNDGMVDGTVYSDMLGQFTIDLQNVNLPAGSQTVKLRAGHTQNGPMFPAYGAWSNFGFTYSVPPPALPVIGNLSLTNDTSTSGDLITSDARVTGTLTVTNSSAAYLPVEYDFNGDGIADGTTQTDMMGQFTVDLRSANLTAGTYTVTMRGGRYLNGPMTPTFGEQATFTFTYTVPALPVVGSLALVNDTGTPNDLITSDARISGVLTLADASAASLPVQYDFNGDGIVDGTLQTNSQGQFTVDLRNSNLAAGTYTVAMRGGRTNGPMSTTYGSWTSFSLNYVPPALPTISGLHLTTDTGEPGDFITSIAQIDGTFSWTDGTINNRPIQVDLNGDGTVDRTIYSDQTGAFHIDLGAANLGPGVIHARFRGGIPDASGTGLNYGAWSALQFTYQAPSALRPVVTDVHLVNDTDTADDFITSDPRVAGTIVNPDGFVIAAPVQVDLNGDGIAEATVTTALNGSGDFVVDLDQIAGLVSGTNTVRLRAGELSEVGGEYAYGDWEEFQFEYVAPPSVSPQVTGLSLTRNTGDPEDTTTSDARISGYVTRSEGAVDSLTVEYDVDGDGTIDGSVFTSSDGTGAFQIDLREAGLAAGPVTVRVRSGDFDIALLDYDYGAWQTFTFIYELPGPILPEITNVALFEDTWIPDDGITGDTRLVGLVTMPDDTRVSSFPIQVDVNGDGVADGSAFASGDGSGTFEIRIDPELLPDGPVSARLRGGVWNYGTLSYDYGDWAEFEFVYEAPLSRLPQVTALGLLNDTGEDDEDNVTADGRIAGIVTLIGDSVSELPVQYSIDGSSWTSMVYTAADESGAFTIDLRDGMMWGEHTIKVRAAKWDPVGFNFVFGDWEEFTFTLEWANLTPVVSNLHLVVDTDNPTDKITADATIAGNVSNDLGVLAGIPLQYDSNHDGVSDGIVYTNEDGGFVLDLNHADLSGGPQWIQIRAGAWSDQIGMYQWGGWNSFGFTYVDPAAILPVVQNLQLLENTGDPNDLTTSVLYVTGTVTDNNGPVSSLPVEYDLNGDGVADGTVYTDSGNTGEFLLDLTYAVTVAGTVQVKVRAGEFNNDDLDYRYGAWATFTFTYQTDTIEEEIVDGDSGSDYLPADVAYATYLGPNLVPNLSASEGTSAGFTGFDAPVANFEQFESRFAPAAGGPFNITTPISTSTTVTSTDSFGGVTTVTTVTAGSLTQVATVGAAGSWTYDETLTSTYIVTTNYLRPDGTTYVLVQAGSHDYVFESSGDSAGSTYSLTETIGDEFDHTRSNSQSSTQGEDQHTRDAKFDNGGQRGATFTAAGTRTNRPGGGWSTTETQDYATTGDTGYNNDYRDHVTPVDPATTGSGVDSTGKQSKYGAYNSVRVINTDSDGTWSITDNFDYETSDKTSFSDGKSKDTDRKSGTSSTTGPQRDKINTSQTLTGTSTDDFTVTGTTTTKSDGTFQSTTTNTRIITITDTLNLSGNNNSTLTDSSGSVISVTSSGTQLVTRSYSSTQSDTYFHDYNGFWSISGTSLGSNSTTYTASGSSVTSVTGGVSNGPGSNSLFSINATNGGTATGTYTFNSSGAYSKNSLGASTSTATIDISDVNSGTSNWDRTENGQTTTTSSYGGITTKSTESSTTTDAGSGTSSSSFVGHAQLLASGQTKYSTTFNSNSSSQGVATVANTSSSESKGTTTYNKTTTDSETSSSGSYNSTTNYKSSSSTTASDTDGNKSSTTTSSGSSDGTESSSSGSSSKSESVEVTGPGSKTTTKSNSSSSGSKEGKFSNQSSSLSTTANVGQTTTYSSTSSSSSTASGDLKSSSASSNSKEEDNQNSNFGKSLRKSGSNSSSEGTGTYSGSTSSSSQSGTGAMMSNTSTYSYSETSDGTSTSGNYTDNTYEYTQSYKGNSSSSKSGDSSSNNRSGTFNSSSTTDTKTVDGSTTTHDVSSRTESGDTTWSKGTFNSTDTTTQTVTDAKTGAGVKTKTHQDSKNTDTGTKGKYSSTSSSDYTTVDKVTNGKSSSSDTSSGDSKNDSSANSKTESEDTTVSGVTKKSNGSGGSTSTGTGTFSSSSSGESVTTDNVVAETGKGSFTMNMSGTSTGNTTTDTELKMVVTDTNNKTGEGTSHSERNTTGTYLLDYTSNNELLPGKVTTSSESTKRDETGTYKSNANSDRKLEVVRATDTSKTTENSSAKSKSTGEGGYSTGVTTSSSTDATGKSTSSKTETDSSNGKSTWDVSETETSTTDSQQNAGNRSYSTSTMTSWEKGSGLDSTSNKKSTVDGKTTTTSTSSSSGDGTAGVTTSSYNDSKSTSVAKSGTYSITTTDGNSNSSDSGTFNSSSSSSSTVNPDGSTSMSSTSSRSDNGTQTWFSTSTKNVTIKGPDPKNGGAIGKVGGGTATTTDKGSGTYSSSSSWTSGSGGPMGNAVGSATRTESGGGKTERTSSGGIDLDDGKNGGSSSSSGNGLTTYTTNLTVGRTVGADGVEVLTGDYSYSSIGDSKVELEANSHQSSTTVVSNPSPGITVKTTTENTSKDGNVKKSGTNDYSSWSLTADGKFESEAGTITYTSTDANWEKSSSSTTVIDDKANPSVHTVETQVHNTYSKGTKGASNSTKINQLDNTTTTVKKLYETGTSKPFDSNEKTVETTTPSGVETSYTYWESRSERNKNSDKTTTNGATTYNVDENSTSSYSTKTKLTGGTTTKNGWSTSTYGWSSKENRDIRGNGRFESSSNSTSESYNREDTGYSGDGYSSSSYIEDKSKSKSDSNVAGELYSNGERRWNTDTANTVSEWHRTTHYESDSMYKAMTSHEQVDDAYESHRTLDNVTITTQGFNKHDRVSSGSMTENMGGGSPMSNTWSSEEHTNVPFSWTYTIQQGMNSSSDNIVSEVLAGFGAGFEQGLDNIGNFLYQVGAGLGSMAGNIYTEVISLYNDIVLILNNFDAFITELAVAIPQTFADGRAFDSLQGATQSLVENTLNLPPGTIPISPLFGNQEAFDNGRVVGDYWAAANMIALSGVAGSLQCGTTAAKAIAAVDRLGDAIAVGQSVNNLMNGEAGIGDALTVGAALLGGPSTGCFVADTLVHLRAPGTAITVTDAAPQQLVPPEQNDQSTALTVILVTVGMAGFAMLERERQREPHFRSRPRGPARMTFTPLRLEPDSSPPLERAQVPTDTLRELTLDLKPSTSMNAEFMFNSDNAFHDDAIFESQSGQAWLGVEEGDLSDDWTPLEQSRGPSFGVAWLVACLLLAFGSFCPLHQLPSIATPASAATSVHDLDVIPEHTMRIQDIRIGQRVLGKNPELPRSQASHLEIANPEDWREYVLNLPKPTGGEVNVQLLETVTWLQENSQDGVSVDLNLQELGVQGRAQVLEIRPCPEIEPDDGSGRPVVTGTFHHRSVKVIDLAIEGEPEPIGVTENHPFWSKDREQFVAAGDINAGELLQTASGSYATIIGKTYRHGLHDVYNLQIDGEHVYHVGVEGVLVHNACGKKLHEIGAAREAVTLAKLQKQYPNAQIYSQRTLRDANGKKLISSDGTGRRLDFVVVENGKVKSIVEATGLNVNKRLQGLKTRELLKRGAYMRIPGTDTLIRIRSTIKEIIDRSE